jgi:SPP1 family predicted phage head-tail adaptor
VDGLMLAAGKLDRRIALERATAVQDSTGQAVETWSPLATVWASWRRASARETLAAAEVAAAVTDVFEIRWSTRVRDVSPEDRLTYEDRLYAIVEVTEIGRREGLRIAATTRVDA